MRKITIRQLQQNMFRELENLPVVITRKGIDTFIIRGIENVTTSDNVTTSKSQDVTTSFKLCKYPMCNNYAEDNSDYCKSHK